MMNEVSRRVRDNLTKRVRGHLPESGFGKRGRGELGFGRKGRGHLQ